MPLCFINNAKVNKSIYSGGLYLFVEYGGDKAEIVYIYTI